MAANDYDRASYVHDGDEIREDMARYFAGRPRAERVRVVEVEAPDDDSAVVTAGVSYADGTAGEVKVVVRKGEPAWLVDWPATWAPGGVRAAGFTVAPGRRTAAGALANNGWGAVIVSGSSSRVPVV
jgi:hypothetical protein